MGSGVSRRSASRACSHVLPPSHPPVLRTRDVIERDIEAAELRVRELKAELAAAPLHRCYQCQASTDYRHNIDGVETRVDRDHCWKCLNDRRKPTTKGLFEVRRITSRTSAEAA